MVKRSTLRVRGSSVVCCGVIKTIMNLSRCLGVCPYALTSLIFVLAALSQKVQGSGKS